LVTKYEQSTAAIIIIIIDRHDVPF